MRTAARCLTSSLKMSSAAQFNNLMHTIAGIDGVMPVSRLGLNHWLSS